MLTRTETHGLSLMPDVVHHDPARYQNASRTGGAGHDAPRLPGRGEYPVTHRSHVYRHAVHTAPGTSRASRLGREMLRVVFSKEF